MWDSEVFPLCILILQKNFYFFNFFKFFIKKLINKEKKSMDTAVPSNIRLGVSGVGTVAEKAEDSKC